MFLATVDCSPYVVGLAAVILGHARGKCRPLRLAETGTFTVHHFPDNLRIVNIFCTKILFLKGGKVSRAKPGVNNSTPLIFVTMNILFYINIFILLEK